MKVLMRRSATAFFALLMMFSIGLWSNQAEAAANITWTTTDVTLESGKCTVHGYFKNDGNIAATASTMKLVVHTWDALTEVTIYDFAYSWAVNGGNELEIPSGAQISWYFELTDKNCPAYDGPNKRWSVVPTVGLK